MAVKPRFRVSAGDAQGTSVKFTTDSFQNFVAQVGIGANNTASGGTYGFNPITRDKLKLEWMYRGSWIVRQIIDSVAEDMTRAGIKFQSEMEPDEEEGFTRYLRELLIFDRLQETLKWGRLYGGAIAVMMVDGQRTETPLRVDAVGRNQFKGLLVMDRWMLQPSLENLVTDLGPDYGQPKFYNVIQGGTTGVEIPQQRIHHSRIVRVEGIHLPYWQRIAENQWGMSVLEPVFDRLLAFDSATQGAAQLVYRAHLRTYKVKDLRLLIAAGGTAYRAFLEQMQMIRLMQANEGLTLLDMDDEFETHQYTFAGLSDVLVQFGQQLSGATQIPLVRLFGQSPAGMNATGESDFRNYYDGINSQQESRLRRPIATILELAHRSKFGVPLPEGFNFTFNSLWQLTDEQKAAIGSQNTQSVSAAYQDGIIDRATALKELRQSSQVSGLWTNITDDLIQEAEDEPPPGSLEAMQQQQAIMQPPGEETPSDEADNGGGEGSRSDSPLLPENAGGKVEDLLKIRQSRQQAIKRIAGLDQAPMLEFQGIPIIIETQNGERRGFARLPLIGAAYGYIQGTGSAEGPQEQMDCFVGPNKDSQQVWIIDQVDPDTRQFDEHKIMLGFDSEEEALAAYIGAFDDNRGEIRVGDIHAMRINQLRQWLQRWMQNRAEG